MVLWLQKVLKHRGQIQKVLPQKNKFTINNIQEWIILVMSFQHSARDLTFAKTGHLTISLKTINREPIFSKK